MAFLGIDGLVTVGYGMLYCFHTSFTAQLHMFPQNMYVLNRYANYPNGNQEAWPLQLAGLFPFHFSCNTSQSLVMKHNVLWRLYVAHSAAGNWMFLSPQPDLTPPQCDVTHSASTPEASNYNTETVCKCMDFLCISNILVCAGVIGINAMWMKPCVHQASASVKVVTVRWLYTVYQSFCCLWLRAGKIQYVFTSTHKCVHARTSKRIYGFSLHLIISSWI